MNCIQTKTGDIMHVSECNENGVTYGVISITLKNGYHRLNDAEAALVQFLQQLQPIFAIQHSTGVATTHDACASIRALTDYWQDEEQKDWKVKGWTNGATINVLYIKNIALIPVIVEDYFFNPSFFTAS